MHAGRVQSASSKASASASVGAAAAAVVATPPARPRFLPFFALRGCCHLSVTRRTRLSSPTSSFSKKTPKGLSLLLQ